jgi:hypothetical protein
MNLSKKITGLIVLLIVLTTSSNILVASAKTKVIPRSSWGANEDYRYLIDGTKDPVLVETNDEYFEKYKDELTYARVIEKDSKGNAYKWPLQYAKKVSKFIIHHTATTKDLKNPEKAIKNIYKYHALNRGWGDVGYNYFIDTKGRVYEGRFGGEGVVGAHAGNGNTGSIGIALLGDYENNDLPNTVVAALAKFISEKAKIHKVNVTGKTEFRGEKSDNIIGHKDVMATQCPGANLYAKLPLIRELAKKNYAEKKKFTKDYDFQDESDLYYIELTPNETDIVEIKLENIGKKTWNSDTYLSARIKFQDQDVIEFPDMEGAMLAKMEETSVAPGKNATFKIKVKGGKADIVTVKLSPVINGKNKVMDYLEMPVTVFQSQFTYKFISKNFPSKALKPGEKFTATVKLKNTGNTIWRKAYENIAILAKDHDRGDKSDFRKPASAKMGFLKEKIVKPGETGTFEMELYAPSEPGYYREYFSPLVDNEIWMSDTGLYFDVVVAEEGEDLGADLISAKSMNYWEQGSRYKVWLNVRNTGQSTWTKKDISMGFIKDKGMSLSGARLINGSVAPGKIARLEFYATVKADHDISKNNYILVRLKKDGENVMKLPFRVKYDVVAKKVAKKVKKKVTEKVEKTSPIPKAKSKEGDIRVKLSYSGNPQVTANGDFTVYDGNKKIKTQDKNDTVTIEKNRIRYKVKIDGKTYTKSGPIRIVPSSGTILEIENFDHAPGWNEKLNDNQYRGILEINQDGGELIVINELPLEDYLKGLGEVSDYENEDKIKAIMVAARTYAKYYLEKDEKFPGKPYDLNDDPESCQKYLGYGLEKRSPKIAEAIKETKGEVVTYKGELVKTPYFSQSDGSYTKDPDDVWGWSAAYLKPVKDSVCNEDKFLGHGVGLSGCGAKGMAESGKTYQEILKYYYSGVEISEWY